MSENFVGFLLNFIRCVEFGVLTSSLLDSCGFYHFIPTAKFNYLCRIGVLLMLTWMLIFIACAVCQLYCLRVNFVGLILYLFSFANFGVLVPDFKFDWILLTCLTLMN